MRLAVVGAGGHAKVVVATAQACGYEVVGLYDDDPTKAEATVLGVPVRGRVAEVAGAGCAAVFAIGDNRSRKSLGAGLDLPLATLVHPAAVVHESVEIGGGTVIFAGVVVQPGARLGHHVILNTGATVDHDCELGDWVHCAPGSHLAGRVTVGEGALLGVGSAVIPDLRIGAWAVLGAGSTAVEDVADGVRVGGVPARPLSR